jgi:hypothetical protein
MTTRSRLRGLLALLVAALPAAGRADLFSPGELSRAHQNLEGLQNCTKCHEAGQQLSQKACLACHGELRGRIAGGRGLHGRIPEAERACEKCHHEHQGRDFSMMGWGPGGKKGFDHARTGFELRGKHRRTDCEKCHDRRLVQDPVALELFAKQPDRKSQLGAPTACAACHVDEHRGQVGADCQRCHGEDAWKPARPFKHARSAYPLTGKHARVACEKCHRSEPAPEGFAPTPGQVGPVNAAAVVRYKPLEFKACTDCHKDPHQGRFGERCASCHTTADWKKLSSTAQERAFHDKTRYPLRGAHADVKCVACHGPFPGVKAVFRGLPFERCTDCHLDSHLGQLARATVPPPPANGRNGVKRRSAPPAPAGPACESCHLMEGWLPVRFETAEHAKLDYRLEGAHRAVACALCHPKDPRLEQRVPAAVRRDLGRRQRPVQVSTALLDIPRANDCRTCHRDPHGRQFDARMRPAPDAASPGGCAACHGMDSFHRPRFDHSRDSRYPLEGKHVQAACGSCHRPDREGVVRYKPLPLTCAGCHADVHAGQLAVKGQGTDCARCHVAAGWKEPLRFKHDASFTRFPLEGKHAPLACDKCHGLVRVAGVDVRRYSSLPLTCQGCHDDFHRGAFRGFALAAVAARPPSRAAGRPDLAVRGGRAVAAPNETDCAACHTAVSWRASNFAHERTGFPLEGAHRQAACGGCHTDRTFKAPVARACGACHADVHAGRLGGRCERCHEATSWAATTFDADAHRRGNFPLTGRHAATACDACHASRVDLGFTRPTRECLGCHQDALARASAGGAAVDHGTPAFPTRCQACHSTWRFTPASLAGHEACFDIARGPHAGIRCKDCHTTFPPVDVGQPLTCLTDTTSCQRCHSCLEHEAVPGFACAERKCYECHRFASTGGGLRSPLRGVHP